MVRQAKRTDIELWQMDPHNEMRPLEVAEVWAAGHFAPIEAVELSLKDSIEAYTITHDFRMVGMFGIIPDSLLSDRAVVWLLTTEEIYKMRIRFLRLTRHFIAKLRTTYPVLYNWVDARNAQCVRWLKWAGAEVCPAAPAGADGVLFHFFTIGGQ